MAQWQFLGLDVGSWSQWAGAAASSCAVAVAVFGDRFRYWVHRPKLRLKLKDAVGITSSIWITEPNREWFDERAHWFHLRVSNPSRWFPVKAARPFLLGVERFDGRRFVQIWEGETPLMWRYQADYGGPTRDLGFPGDVDAFSLHADGAARLRPAVPHSAGLVRVHKAPLRIRLLYEVRGNEADSNPVTIELDWDGTFREASEGGAPKAVVTQVMPTR